jgi:hypothetical protein
VSHAVSATGANGAQFLLHVGMPKCGSSALQTALSMQPEIDAGQASAARYVVVGSNQLVLQGEQLSLLAARAGSGYLVSARASDFAAADSAAMKAMRESLARAAADGRRVVLSNEGWGHEYEAFAHGRFLENLGIECDIVLYVRPQTAWCNAAWWQWGAWTGAPINRWVARQLERLRWSRVVEGWRSVGGVREVHVRLLPPNIVGDFHQFAGLAAPAEVVSNSGLPGSVLRVFQRHRELREGPHDSAIEFALGRHLQLQRAVSPWVLRPEIVRQIIEACRESNLELLGQLAPEQRHAMQDDPAWWEVDHYAGREVESWKPRPAAAAELDQLAAAALAAIERLDERNRLLEFQIRELQRGNAAGETEERPGRTLLTSLLGRRNTS